MKYPTLSQAFETTDFLLNLEKVKALALTRIKDTEGPADTLVYDYKSPEEELAFWQDQLESTTNSFFESVFKRTTNVQHPNYVGHQVATPAPLTAVTGLVNSLLNNGMAVYEMGMSPSAIERVVTDKICEAIGFDSQSGGFLTSGGTLANLTALLAARKEKVASDIWNNGLQQQLGIMVCEEAHYCIDRAARIMGLGSKGIIKIPAKDNYAMDTSCLEYELEKARNAGIAVFAIVGSAPSTATGAYDNLEAIGKFAAKNNLWFHVDGAHGGAAIYSDKYSYLLNGIANADSVVIDGHKMLLMPIITTALLFKNKWHAQRIFSQQADYLLDDTQEDQWYQSGKKTFECTKSMMSLHWFILMKTYGNKLFNEYVTRQYDLAKEFEALLRNDKDFEVAVSPQSNILCFRIVKQKWSTEKLNQLNADIRKTILANGSFYLVQTKLKGIHYLRTSLMNPFTELSHLSELVKQIKATALIINP